jgi:hypothetical protein
VEQRRVGFDACEAVGETFAGHEPAHEQGRFAAGDKGDLAAQAPSECLGVARHSNCLAGGFRRAVVKDGRRVPQPEADLSHRGRDGVEAGRVAGDDAHVGRVQFVADHLEFSAHDTLVEVSAGRALAATKHRAGVVDHSPDPRCHDLIIIVDGAVARPVGAGRGARTTHLDRERPL